MYTSSYHSPRYLITPQTILTSQKYGDPKNADWLNNAIELNSALISSAPDIRDLAEHILPEIKEAVFERDNYRCQMCRKVFGPENLVFYYLNSKGKPK